MESGGPGKPFGAWLVLKEHGKVEFDFPARAQTKEAAVAEYQKRGPRCDKEA
jgi:hypothetical protein